ncbi:MAG: tRNA preQ1(34) S-adenosylmethionine ribosyltransferase-isomerase QueA [Actinobacteria bacterium]|nr:MAG: tRNA preQ1(34) S-adenosylmethionine ribosyltransferase-isomerase QueA [Actinomycetota bacterium]
MKTDELDYNLPEKLIAQEPVEPRNSSKLLVLNRKTKQIGHHQFFQIGDFLKPGDLLVVNDTKVLPARIKGQKTDTKASIELLLLSPSEENKWEVLAKPAKRLKPGSVIDFNADLKVEVLKELEDGRRLVLFKSKEPLLKILQEIGEIPLPPYIVKPLLHPERYQTVYAQKQESAAAPTAGLHFTSKLIQSLKDFGVKFASITLRIGLDTFQPIREEEVEDHKIHSEHYKVGQVAADLINEARNLNHRIIAVGTTSARVLETLAKKNFYEEQEGSTDLFIYPGYKFKAVDAMITNFHLPRSTLLAMVSSFASIDGIRNAYSEAIKKGYRFFSFGDAMLII